MTTDSNGILATPEWLPTCGHHCGIANLEGTGDHRVKHCAGCHARPPGTGGCDELGANPALWRNLGTT